MIKEITTDQTITDKNKEINKVNITLVSELLTHQNTVMSFLFKANV